MIHVWACWVFGANVSCHSPITGFGYIDDRLLLLRGNRNAVSRSGQFDRDFGLEVSLNKCAVGAASKDRGALDLANSLNYMFQQTVEMLGVKAAWGHLCGLLRFSVHKSVLRLRAMRSLKLRSLRARDLVRSLAATWAAAYATPDPDELRTLQKEVEAGMFTLAGHGAAKVLFYEITGWWLDRRFALDECTLREFWRNVVRPGAWTEELPLSHLQGWVCRCLPNVPPLLARLGWSFSPDPRVVCTALMRKVNARTIHLGRESFRGVRQWLVVHCRHLYVSSLDRLWHVTLACVAAGASTWHFNAGGDFPANHARHLCLCEKRLPSRPHLAWNCPCLPVEVDLQMPTDRAAERLFPVFLGSKPFQT